ncbi:hypothetical protein [Streptomyces sp. WMMB303]|uniref:hypothetical protein n=1 Tax=Streptomyces sp. WMMB303 TaxID=3034154 RepID=UPI0023EDAEE8|nr:hypothetical protein [Streptomyces sp. WMMB303]MDF4249479.1 hypothetical protein [Streptomyces sp. WMMB303]
MPPEPATTTPRGGTWYGACPRCKRPLELTSGRDATGRVVSVRCRHCPPAQTFTFPQEDR